jgi:type IV pilus assembly protein PilY1
MRLGGACRDNTAICTDCVRSPVSGNEGLSSYFAIDVTNPESPRVLWEFSRSDLGFATTGPAVIRINAENASGNPDRTLNGKWYVVFGSGPTGPIDNTIRQFLGRSDQNLKLFVVDLKTGTSVTPIDTGIPYAFAGSMINSTADVNLDYSDDALYVGYVKPSGGTWNQGGVLRLLTKGSGTPSEWAVSTLIDDIGPVTSSLARLQNNILHTNWLFFGTGRYYFSAPSGSDDPYVQRRLYGVKDPCFTIVNTLTPTCTTTVDEADLASADTPPVTEPARGWFINLDTVTPIAYDNTAAKKYYAERVITDPLSLSTGAVFFTTYRPYGDDCAIGGRTFLWAVQYNTGGAPQFALRGRALMQVSTASVEQLDLSTAFSQGNAMLNRGNRRSYSLEGVPPTAQGLSLLSPPPPVKRILHMIER